MVNSIWFIGWTAHAITHGLNPLFSGALNYPFGVNAASNPTSPLLEFLATPLTVLWGPVTSFNFLMHLALAGSAFSMYWVLRRLGLSWQAALCGGLLYGFSPYEQAHALGHLNLTFTAVIPLLFLAFERIWSSPNDSRRRGLVFGLLAAAQYLISSELLADAALLMAIASLSILLARPSIVRAAWPRLRGAVAWGAASFAALVAAPVAFMLVGPQHFNGPPIPIRSFSSISNDLLGPLVPTSHQLIGTAALFGRGDRFLASTPAENGGYLGAALVVLVIAFTLIARRRRLIKLSAWLAGVAFVLSLGPRLRVDGARTAIGLPFAIVDRIGLLQMEIPARYSLFVALFATVVVAIGVDELLRLGGISPVSNVTTKQHTGLGAFSYRSLAAGVFLLTATLLIPRWPIASAPTAVPQLFNSPAIKRIPPASVLLAYPYPVGPVDYAMLWQAVSGFRFKLIGDYAYTPIKKGPQGTGGGGWYPPALPPTYVEILFQEAFGYVPNAHVPKNHPAALRLFLVRYHVSTVILDPIGAHPLTVAKYLTRALGARPTVLGGVLVWFRVDQDLVSETNGLPRPHRSM